LVFGHVFQIFGYSQTSGIIAATAVQIFCFGTVTILGGVILLSRGSVTIWRAQKWISPGADWWLQGLWGRDLGRSLD
jgi:hypothetical protein